jgi:ParB-like chromosome segregation protein Spo0J
MTEIVTMAGRLEHWPIAELVPYEKNPRTHTAAQVTKIAASIIEFGWTQPILVDQDKGVVAGHGRLAAARELGLETVPVIQLTHLTPAQKRAYVIADNRLALDAGWDEELLRTQLQELAGEDFSLQLTGFDDKELATFLADEPAAPAEEGGAGQGGRASRSSAIASNVEFDDAEQLATWSRFLRYLAAHSDLGTVGARLAEFIVDNGYDVSE